MCPLVAEWATQKCFRLFCVPGDETIPANGFEVVLPRVRRRLVEVVTVVRGLQVQRCFSTASPSWGIHVLDSEADAGLCCRSFVEQ